jgi:hypothetical protein
MSRTSGRVLLAIGSLPACLGFVAPGILQKSLVLQTGSLQGRPQTGFGLPMENVSPGRCLAASLDMRIPVGDRKAQGLHRADGKKRTWYSYLLFFQFTHLLFFVFVYMHGQTQTRGCEILPAKVEYCGNHDVQVVRLRRGLDDEALVTRNAHVFSGDYHAQFEKNRNPFAEDEPGPGKHLLDVFCAIHLLSCDMLVVRMFFFGPCLQACAIALEKTANGSKPCNPACVHALKLVLHERPSRFSLLSHNRKFTFRGVGFFFRCDEMSIRELLAICA